MILPKNMLLKKLINSHSIKKNIKIKGLADNSKKVKSGYIFFAIKGNHFDGEKFIDEAVKKGAVVVICAKNCNYNNSKILVIKTSNIRHLLSKIASRFYNLKPKRIIAVTGTNGKTSVADLFYQLLSLNNIEVASIGTLGIKYKNKIFKTNLTSPNTISLHKTLEKLKRKKIENVIIEASSHGLHQKRIHHIHLKAGIFTNFSQDHLDYHNTMRSYLNAKLTLFSNILSKNKTVISDKSINEFSILKKISRKRNLRLIDISPIREKIKKLYNMKFNELQLNNLAMAIAAAKLCNLSERKIYNSLNKIKDVNGRLELVRNFTNNVKVYVDFAHTPDALLKSLRTLKKIDQNNVSIVFGCGGNRDLKKRPLMAKIVSANCKKIYVTDDNPRDEKPENIRQVILKNIKNKNSFNIGNREKAIKFAISNSDPNEIILVAGKGHETQQIYKDKILSISDKQIIKRLKIKIKKITLRDQNFLQNKKIIYKFNKNIKLKNFHGISIDSRTAKKNNLFLTIKGKNHDGVKFIPAVLKKGISQIVSSKRVKRFENKIIKVSNEIKFLNYFAKEKRKLSKAKIFAITGSAGKTSLKNLLSKLLNKFGKTLSSYKSYNNHFGVPLSLSQLNIDHKYGIFEVGMSKLGEINTLTKLIRPHIGIITNIGEAHIENFKNLRGIADAKGEILNNIEKNGTLIFNRDDKYFNYLEKKAKSKNINLISYGKHKKSHIRLLKITKNKKNKTLIIKCKNQFLKLIVKNINVYNVLSSLALLSELNLDLEKISRSFNRYEPTEGRGKIHKIKRYKKRFNLIDESYNANPLSVKNAIKNFEEIEKKDFKKYLLLGDMLELGSKSKILHKNLSKVINKSDIDKVFIKGIKTLITYKNISKHKRGNIFQQDEDVDFTLKNIIANNDYLMIKGSNATGLNNLSKRIIKGY
tara:strand:- start:318 stop:3095 length:2778 start_codon:yes stop_codon:yes gene_type:complete